MDETIQKVLKIQRDTLNANILLIWTIYNHPTDYPDGYIARAYKVNEKGSHVTDETITSTDLEYLRMVFMRAGLACLMRNPNDDYKIIESWL